MKLLITFGFCFNDFFLFLIPKDGYLKSKHNYELLCSYRISSGRACKIGHLKV